MGAKRGKIFLILLATAAIGALIWYARRPEPIEVAVEAVSRGSVERTVVNTRAGTVKACRRAYLSPATGGQLARLEVREGDRVTKGQLLLELWNKDQVAQVALNEAEADAAIATARKACLESEVARRDAERLRRLGPKGGVSVEELDQANTKSQAALAGCESANSSTRTALARVEVNRAQLERTQLFAPFDGIVAEVNGELNEYVTPSPPGIPTPPAIDLIDTSCFYVAAPIDEVDAPKVELGQPARVSLDAFGYRHFSGKVRRIAAYVLDREKQARTVEVEVEFSDPADHARLLAGYSADVEIVLETREGVLRVPSEAVIDEKKVLVFDEAGGVLVEREIKPGIANWDDTEVLSGVTEGDLVVTNIDKAGVEAGAAARRAKAEAE